jgi:anhydro-N-acetylmuramic acid kinase
MDKMMRAIGLMSGTSADGVDAAIIETDGLSRIDVGVDYFRPYSNLERGLIRQAYQEAKSLEPGSPLSPGLIDASRVVTRAHVEAVQNLLAKAQLTSEDIDLIGFHGQTVLHDPSRRFTVQIGYGEELASALKIDVVYDFRTNDVLAGGQGAPFAPLYHAARVADQPKPVAVLNLGGVGNVTIISENGEVVAFDTGPGNALIDDWVFKATGAACDHDGTLAGAGRADPAVVTALMAHPYFNQKPPKSLDRDAFFMPDLRGVSIADGAASLSAFTIESIVAARDLMPEAPKRWLVTGGGRHNRHLMAGLKARLNAEVQPVEAAGLRGDSLEAETFAYLAVRSVKGLPLSLPTTTGVPAPMTGGRKAQANRV